MPPDPSFLPSLAIAAFAILPALRLAYNYYLTGSKDFGIFSLIFVLFIISMITRALGYQDSVIYGVSSLLQFVLVYVICYLILGADYFRNTRIVFFVITFLVILITAVSWRMTSPTTPLSYFVSIPDTVKLGIMVMYIYDFFAGVAILYTWRKAKPLMQDPRIHQVNLMWATLGVGMCVFSFYYTFFWLYQILNPTTVFNFFNILILYCYNALIGGITFIIALRYPEFMLMTEVQILRAKKLYMIVELTEGEIRTSFTKKTLQNYIRNVPQDILQKLRPDER